MKDRPNIILIMTDQQRFDAMSAHGNPICRTPNLDALAARSVDFTRAYCPQPLCSPSRATLMTGRTIVSHRVFSNNHIPLPDDEVTFTELLADAGYSCALSGKWHLGNEGDAQRGFTRWVNHRGGWRDHLEAKEIPYDHASGGLRRFGTQSGLPTPPLQGPSVVEEDDMMVASVTRHARRMLTELRDEKPFFLKYSIYEPHPPIEVPEPYYSQLDPDTLPLPDNFEESYDGKPQYLREARGRGFAAHLDEAQWRMMRAVYFHLVSLVDRQIGLFLNDLEACGMLDDSLIVFTSDHGDMTGNHHLAYKGSHFYEEQMRVPFLVHYPGQKSGSTYQGIAAMEDIAPTILDAAGVSIPERMEGVSLMPIGSRDRVARDAAFAARYTDAEDPRCGRMTVTDRWKYVWHPCDLDELYDLRNDPGEQQGLAESADHRSVLEELRMRTKRWMESVNDPLAEAVGVLA